MIHAAEDPILYQVRPRFQIETKLSVQLISDKLKEGLEAEDAPCQGRVKQDYATLTILKKDQHYWSPQLGLNLIESDKGTDVRGLYGPRPEVWTMFIFFYFVIGLVTLIVAIIGLANMSIDKSGAILWTLPALVIIFLSLYAVSYFGQKLGHDQMLILHKFVENSTGLEIP